jgi:hypothetical protein
MHAPDVDGVTTGESSSEPPAFGSYQNIWYGFGLKTNQP